MERTFTAKELSRFIGKTTRTIQNRAAKEQWPYSTTPGRGGEIRRYTLSSLPPDLQLLILKEGESRQPAPASMPAVVLLPVPQAGTPSLPAPSPGVDGTGVKKRHMELALAKDDLLRRYRQHLDRAPRGKKKQARETFERAYNEGLLYPELFVRVGPVSWKTIEGWKLLKKERGDVLVLADRRGKWKKGARIVTEAQGNVLLSCTLQPSSPRISEAIRLARAVMESRGIENGHSEATYRRWLMDWRSRNHHIWVFKREGAKAWNDQCAYYIERDYDRLDVGDVIVADGHPLNFEILSPWTGKPTRMILVLWYDMKSSYPLAWEITPTEDTAAISSALRKAILRLGKIPQVAYLDNGKAFRGKYFTGADFEAAGFAGLYERLGIRTIFAWPYHGQSKTIERFFGTFQELERWVPTWVGNSIENKPPRMLRGERIHRAVHEKVMAGSMVTLEGAHRAVAAWFDMYAARPQKGHLNGQAPGAVFEAGRGDGVDPERLSYLMMSLDIRTVNRNGIRFRGDNYYHAGLYGRRHAVKIRYDLQDSGILYVYDQDDTFICAAEPTRKVHPAAAILGTPEDQAVLAEQIQVKRGQAKEASASARTFLEEEILPEHRRRMAVLASEAEAKAGSLPAPVPLDEAAVLAEVEELRAMNADMHVAGGDQAEAYVPEVVSEAETLRRRLEACSEMDRYEALVEMEAQGQMVPKQWQAFMKYFEMTPQYGRLRDYYEEFRAKMALTYQQ